MTCGCVFTNAIVMAIITIIILVAFTYSTTVHAERFTAAVREIKSNHAAELAKQTEQIASVFRK